MIARNPGSGRAYAYRWRYHPGADAAGRRQGHRQGPRAGPRRSRGPARGRHGRPSRGATRPRCGPTSRRDIGSIPKDFAFALSLAQSERQRGAPRPRRGRPSPGVRGPADRGVAFELADTLILEGKIDGKDGANDLITQLRRRRTGRDLGPVPGGRDPVPGQALDRGGRRAGDGPRGPDHRPRPDPADQPDAGRVPWPAGLRRAAARGPAPRRRGRNKGPRRPGSSWFGCSRGPAGSTRPSTTLSPLAVAGTNPEWRLDLVRLLLQKTVRQPRDRRDWPEVEQRLSEAEKAMGGPVEPVVLLRLEVLAAQDRLDDARALLARIAGEGAPQPGLSPGDGPADRSGRGSPTRRCGSSTRPRRTWAPARGSTWPGWITGARRAATPPGPRSRSWRRPAGRSPPPTGRRSSIASARWRSGSAGPTWRGNTDASRRACSPRTSRIRLRLFDLALLAGDRDEPARLIDEIRKIEGEAGVNWRFAQAALLIDQARRGSAEAPRGSPPSWPTRSPSDKPNWWVGPGLERRDRRAGRLDRPGHHVLYLQALELGNVQPSFARRLVALLDQQGRQVEVDRVMRGAPGPGRGAGRGHAGAGP